MFAIDTNIVIRFLVNDDPDQSAKARDFIAREKVFVALTVILEAEWVLRSGYGFDRATVVKALRAFAGLPNILIDNRAALASALEWAEAGMDFADALHLAQAVDCEAFISFDGRLARAARFADATVVQCL